MFATTGRMASLRCIVQPRRLQISTFFPRNPLSRRQQLGIAESTDRRGFRMSIYAAVKSGSNMEDFPEYFSKVKATTGKEISLSSFKNRKAVVLFFYPKAGTPGCTKEAQKFRDDYKELTKFGAEVFGISGDNLEDQKDFAALQQLPYPLLADENNVLRKGFGVPGDLFGALPGRQTIVISKEGECLLSYNNQLNPESHVAEAIKALSS